MAPLPGIGQCPETIQTVSRAVSPDLRPSTTSGFSPRPFRISGNSTRHPARAPGPPRRGERTASLTGSGVQRQRPARIGAYEVDNRRSRQGKHSRAVGMSAPHGARQTTRSGALATCGLALARSLPCWSVTGSSLIGFTIVAVRSGSRALGCYSALVAHRTGLADHILARPLHERTEPRPIPGSVSVSRCPLSPTPTRQEARRAGPLSDPRSGGSSGHLA